MKTDNTLYKWKAWLLSYIDDVCYYRSESEQQKAERYAKVDTFDTHMGILVHYVDLLEMYAEDMPDVYSDELNKEAWKHKRILRGLRFEPSRSCDLNAKVLDEIKSR